MVWFFAFLTVIVTVFFVIFFIEDCKVHWADRLYILILIPLVSGLMMLVDPTNWWGRFFHWLLTAIIFVFFVVVFFAWLLPQFISADCQPTGTGIPNVCEGGKCNNPFNSLDWHCFYNNTAEAQLCSSPCSTAVCATSMFDPLLRSRSFSHTIVFYFMIVFIVFMAVDMLLTLGLSSRVGEMKLLDLTHDREYKYENSDFNNSKIDQHISDNQLRKRANVSNSWMTENLLN